jgi:two-component system response regulator DesR
LTVLGKPGNLRRALAAGVAGFLPKETPPAQLVESVRRVAAGEKVVDPQLALAALSFPAPDLVKARLPRRAGQPQVVRS